MAQKEIIVLGAGLMGVMSAYYLAKEGYKVKVIEEKPGPGQGASYANGGQISVCYSEPWSSFSNLKKIVKWLGDESAPILLHPKFELKQMLWGAQFLRECLPHRNEKNIKSMLALALFSRQELGVLRKEHALSYEQQVNGILTFYTSEEGFAHGKEAAHFMSQFGCERVIKTREETLALEPTLGASTLPIVGSDYSQEDESGNAYLFLEQMTRICESLGVEFLFGQAVNDVIRGGSKRFKLVLGERNVLETDDLVVCLGVHSYDLMAKLGLYVSIYPAKGYSATVPIVQSELVNKISLTDLDYKIVLTRLGDKLRVAGTAEFNGYDLSVNKARCEALLRRVKQLYPYGLDFERATFWAGLRPATPGNVPLVGRTKIEGLYINAGHGTLGWTMACGSSKVLAQTVQGIRPTWAASE
jgi:D-amino-acid dehydrogenase